MSDLRIEKLAIPASGLGAENPFPALAGPLDLHASLGTSADIPAEDQKYIGYGMPPGCLPYRLQDGYRRKLQPAQLRVAVLENETLRATFLLEFGGRLYSLLHKPSGRELLEVNPVIQPANLAVRNAWCSGGVEWNISLIGHGPFTCAPVFAARVEGYGGTPVLRLYEWERIRRVPFQIDAYLPDGSPVLFVRVSIANPNRTGIPMYWWSNIAVPETSGTRVLAPADYAYRLGYDRNLQRVTIPLSEGTDVSYSTNQNRAMDFFFRIPDGARPWIAALDGQGQGLVQTSTDRLQGRKLFLWGQSAGGKRWQEFLSRPGHSYLEIQAGLARTQAEHLPMPAGAEWEWLEAYGLLQAEPALVHGPDWSQARAQVEKQLTGLISREAMDLEFARGKAVARRAPSAILQHGSGWGALERLRRIAAGEAPFHGSGVVFDDNTLGQEQAGWLNLLRNGELPRGDPEQAPESFMVQDEWRELLEASLHRNDRGAHWLAWLHLGVMRGYAGDFAAARKAYENSLACQRTVWALHDLAVLCKVDKRTHESVQLMTEALRLRPDLPCLAAECGKTLLDAGKPDVWLELLSILPESLRNTGRIVVLEGRAALAAGDLERVAQILKAPPTVDDMQEGEVSLTDIWFGLHEQRLSHAGKIPVDDGLKARVRRDYPPP
ncbi:MAG: DUF5107 domain-containing protein, partial [bacterium]